MLTRLLLQTIYNVQQTLQTAPEDAVWAHPAASRGQTADGHRLGSYGRVHLGPYKIERGRAGTICPASSTDKKAADAAVVAARKALVDAEASENGVAAAKKALEDAEADRPALGPWLKDRTGSRAMGPRLEATLPTTHFPTTHSRHSRHFSTTHSPHFCQSLHSIADDSCSLEHQHQQCSACDCLTLVFPPQ